MKKNKKKREREREFLSPDKFKKKGRKKSLLCVCFS
jgi:hypothetical protein